MKYTKSFYSPPEVAEMAGLTLVTVLDYLASGQLYGIKLPDQTYRIPVRSVARMLSPELLAPSTWVEGVDTDVEAELAEEIAFLKSKRKSLDSPL